MIIFNKYKNPLYLNLDNVFDQNLSTEINAYRVLNLFKHSKKLIRSLLLLHYYIYVFYPFCPLLFKGSARYHLKLNSNILVLSDTDCYDSYFR